MGDIKFKISGTSEPFFARLWNATCSTLQQTEFIETTGTCVTFGNLVGSTCYNVSVVDSIGGIYWSGFTTPTAYVAPELPDRVLTVVGTPYSSTPNTCIVLEPKTFVVTPTLREDESVSFDVNFTTQNTAGSTNYISVRCKPNGGSYPATPDYDYTDEGSNTIRLCLNYGDEICYDMSSYCINGSATVDGCSCLNIVGVTGTCVNASVGTASSVLTDVNYVTTTTTTTTTIAPISIGIDVYALSCEEGVGLGLCLIAQLTPSRALVCNEVVEVFYTTCAQGQKNCISSQEMCTYGYGITSVVPVDICSDVVLWSTDYNEKQCFGQNSFIIDSTNWSNIEFCAQVEAQAQDATVDGYLCSLITLTNVSAHGTQATINTNSDSIGVLGDFRNSSEIRGMFPIVDGVVRRNEGIVTGCGEICTDTGGSGGDPDEFDGAGEIPV